MEARPGGEIRFRWRNWGPTRLTAEDGGAVLEAEPEKRFVFQWQPGESTTTVAIELSPHATGTVVKLTEKGYSSSGPDLTAFVNCSTGWGEALTLLKFYLEHGITYGIVPA